ncbi:TPA: glycosyltransferase family 2 protein [Streptococcus suis]
MEKVSVIVPVYNGEKHLRQCVESIMAQDYKNLEILLINDGSTDGSALLCEQLRQQDPRVRVVHKVKNEGLGAARNTSLEVATGDYIVFVDADDWIDPNHVSDLHELLTRTGSDVAISNFTQYYEETGQFNLHIGADDYYEAVYSPEEWFAFQYGVGHNISLCFTVPWSKMYKKSLFEYILYPTDGFGEDDRTTWKTYLAANRIAYMHRSSLIYRVNAGSMTQTADQATIFSTEPVVERLEVLGLLGFDLSREIAAYKWRSQINRDSKLRNGDVVAYKNLEFRKRMIDKYGNN